MTSQKDRNIIINQDLANTSDQFFFLTFLHIKLTFSFNPIKLLRYPWHFFNWQQEKVFLSGKARDYVTRHTRSLLNHRSIKTKFIEVKTYRFRQTRQSHEDVVSRLNYSFTNALFACSAFLIYILLFSCVLRDVAWQSAYMCMNGFNVYRLFKRRSVSLFLSLSLSSLSLVLLETFTGSQLFPWNGNHPHISLKFKPPVWNQLNQSATEVLVPQNGSFQTIDICIYFLFLGRCLWDLYR